MSEKESQPNNETVVSKKKVKNCQNQLNLVLHYQG